MSRPYSQANLAQSCAHGDAALLGLRGRIAEEAAKDPICAPFGNFTFLYPGAGWTNLRITHDRGVLRIEAQGIMSAHGPGGRPEEWHDLEAVLLAAGKIDLGRALQGWPLSRAGMKAGNAWRLRMLEAHMSAANALLNSESGRREIRAAGKRIRKAVERALLRDRPGEPA